jgi:putative transposase
VRFRFVEEQRGAFPVDRLCRVMNVSPRGLRAFRSRPASRRQHRDMVVLAHSKEQSRLSLGGYGRSRMTEELKEVGVDVGHRRVGRLMREHGIVVGGTKKFKATTDSDHRFNIAPNLLDRDFTADQPNRNGQVTSAMSGLVRGGCISLSSSICIPGVSSAGPSATA